MTDSITASHAIRYWIDLPGGRIVPDRVEGNEALSEPYRFEITVLLDKADIHYDVEQLVRSLVYFGLQRNEIPMRCLQGLITHAQIEYQHSGQCELAIVVEAPIAVMRERSDHRVFRDKTIPEIASEVLAGLSLSADLQLQQPHPSRAYTVQYGETDLAFVERLLADEGIFYFAPDVDLTSDQGGSPVITLADHTGVYQPPAGGGVLPFIPSHGMRVSSERILSLTELARLSVGKVSLRDFNPDTPDLSMDVEAAGPTPGGVERYDYPGEYKTPSDGARKAELIAQGYACEAHSYRAETDCIEVSPAARLTLRDLPAPFALSEVAVRSVQHAWRHMDANGEGRRFELVVVVHKADVAYRPPRTTPDPVLPNPLTGYVTGPAGSDIHTDEMGRVKVHYPWDRLQPRDDNCSDWIPVLQDNTGFSATIPRVGWEVLTGFLEGDPDRPVVLGRIYNGADPFPEPLPEGKTRSALKSLTSPSRDGANELRFDDAAGSELMYQQAEKDENVVVANDKLEEVLNQEKVFVGGNETISVGNDDSVLVGQNQQLAVAGNQDITVAGSHSVAVGASHSSTVQGNRSVTIGGNHKRKVAGYDQVGSNKLKETIAALNLEASVKNNGTSANKIMTTVVGGALIDIAAKDITENTKALRNDVIGGVYAGFSGKGVQILPQQLRTANVAGLLLADGVAGVKLNGGVSLSMSSGALASYEGATKLVLQVGPTSVSFSGGEISVETPGTIVFNGGGSAALLSNLAHLQSPAGADKQAALAAKMTRLSERLALIEQGLSSGDPELVAAAQRLALNNRAVERARLTGHVYNPNDPLPTGWDQIGRNGTPLPPELEDIGLSWDPDQNIWTSPSGLQAGLYQSQIDGSTVLVFRGTENSMGGGIGTWGQALRDWGTNLGQGLGLPTGQYSEAVQLGNAVRDVYGDNVEFAGHSLGGGLASAAGLATGTPTTTINSAGLSPVTRARGAVNAWWNGWPTGSAGDLIDAPYVQGEILNWAQEGIWGVSAAVPDAVGNVRELPALGSDSADPGVSERVDRHGVSPARDEDGNLLLNEDGTPATEGYAVRAIEQQKTADYNTLDAG